MRIMRWRLPCLIIEEQTMRFLKLPIALAATMLFAVTSAKADTITFDFDLTDWGLTSGPVFDFDFDLPVGASASINSVEIQLSHSFAADIDFTMTAPGGFFFDLTSDNGGASDLGDGGSDLTGLSAYTFVDPTNGFGTWTGAGDPVPAGSYDAETWSTSEFATSGWNILLVDDANADDGAVGSVTIDYNLTAIPEPASAGLLGLLGLGFVGLRRRRR